MVRRNGFTLIELPVVITIIIVLLAPALDKAMCQAQVGEGPPACADCVDGPGTW